MKPALVVLGPFPPPVGGAARITEAVAEELEQRGDAALRIDTSVSSLGHRKSLRHHLERLATTLRALVRLTRARPARTLYLVPDAGHGVWYSAVYALMARVLFRRVFIHHHSCRYVAREAVAMRVITRCARARGVHVFLTDTMAASFQDRYGQVSARVVGNAAFTDPPEEAPVERKPGRFRVGHLSNLCGEKGFFRVVAAFEGLRRAGLDVELHLAGPVLEEEVAARLAALRDHHGADVVVHGPLYGADKTAFYDLVDVFLFPTSFDQEAAPTVIYEAAASGAPTVSVDRACIPEMLQALGGAVCGQHDDFSRFTLQWLRAHGTRPSPGDRERVRALFRSERDCAARQYRALLDEIAASVERAA